MQSRFFYFFIQIGQSYLFVYLIGLLIIFFKILYFYFLRIHWKPLKIIIYADNFQDFKININQSIPKNLNMSVKYITLALVIVLTMQQAITIKNRGCKTFDANAVCIACSTRFYMDADKICQPVNPNCNTYNDKNGACITCYPGFGLLENTCLPGIVTQSVDQYCNKFEGITCLKCSFGYYLSITTKKCTILNPLCRTSNQDTGACTACYPGYQLQGNGCALSTQSAAIANCNQIDNQTGKCIKCSNGYYFDANNNCLQTDPSCSQFNFTLRVCINCYPGYNLNQKNQCILQEKKENANPYCALWKDNICQKCAVGSYFGQNRLCVTVNPNCKNFSNNICSSCYSGFDLIDNTCVKSQVKAPKNQLCAQWNNNVCIKCSKGSFFNANNVCALVNPSCLTHDQSNGNCLTCFIGYVIKSGNCHLSNQTSIIDPFCKKFLTADICEQCSDRYYIGQNGLCKQVNPFCNTYNVNNGDCYSCYSGYTLRDKNCFLEVKAITDDNCKTWKDNVCVQCSYGAYFSEDNTCKLADPLCKTFDVNNGACLSCYDSFELIKTKCVNTGPKSVSDANCAEFLEGVCTRCSLGFIFNGRGICSQVSTDCKTFVQSTGQCSSCFIGFDLVNGACAKGVNDVSAIDKNCAKFVSGACVQCSKGFYFGPQGNCLIVDPLCNTFDPLNGQCLTCYPSYILNAGFCIKDTKPSNCVEWFQGACISCAFRNFINQLGSCDQVNINCNTYSPLSGLCTSCYAGYSLRNGQCSLSLAQDSCSKLNEKSECIQCGKGSYLKQGKCIAIDTQCAKFDFAKQTCTSCYEGFIILNGACQISAVEQKYEIQNCYAYDSQSSCIKCYDRFYLRDNICQPVDMFCRQYDDTNGNCISCFSIFTLVNGKCLVQQ